MSPGIATPEPARSDTGGQRAEQVIARRAEIARVALWAQTVKATLLVHAGVLAPDAWKWRADRARRSSRPPLDEDRYRDGTSVDEECDGGSRRRLLRPLPMAP